MGAWGYEIFEDDTACDYACDANTSDDPINLFKESFRTILNSDEPDFFEASDALAAAALIDAIANKTVIPSATLDVEEFIANNMNLSVLDLKRNAVESLKRVIRKGCELNDLWQENEDLYPLWSTNIEQLIKRLEG